MPLFLAQLAVAIGLASVLHFAVERPFLALKDRLRGKRSKQREQAVPVLQPDGHLAFVRISGESWCGKLEDVVIGVANFLPAHGERSSGNTASDENFGSRRGEPAKSFEALGLIGGPETRDVYLRNCSYEFDSGQVRPGVIAERVAHVADAFAGRNAKLVQHGGNLPIGIGAFSGECADVMAEVINDDSEEHETDSDGNS